MSLADERSELKEMIGRSDNRSATRLANAVGTSGLVAVARRAGMRATAPVAAPWGLTRATPQDEASLFARIDELVSPRQRPYPLRALANGVPEQRWGVPSAAPGGSTVLFKGGWLPGPSGAWRVH